MIKLYNRFAATLVFCFVAKLCFAADLPDELIEWSNKNPVINVGIDSHFPPFDFVNENQQPVGIGQLARQALNDILPLTLQVTSKTTFANEFKSLKEGRIDALSICASSEKRSDEVLFTQPILNLTPILAVRKDSDITATDILTSRHKLAVAKGYVTYEYAEQLTGYPNVMQTSSTEEGLRRVANGQLDGFITYLYTLLYAEKQFKFTQLKPLALYGAESFSLGFCVNKEKPELVKILNWGIDELGQDQFRKMQLTWSEHFDVQKNTIESANNTIFWTVSLACIALVVFIIAFSQKYTDEIAIKFGTSKFKSIYVLIISLIVLLLFGGFTWYLSSFKTSSLQEYQRVLNVTESSVATNLLGWYDTRLDLTNSVSELPEFVELTEQLLDHFNQKSILEMQQTTELLDRFFAIRPSASLKGRSANIIGRDGTTLFSTIKELTGSRNVIYEQRPDLFIRIMAGESEFIPAVFSKTDIDGNTSLEDEDAEIYISTPITNSNGKVIAIFAMRFNPFGNFASAFSEAGFGDTLEAYAVDEKARIITESRFKEMLYQRNLLEQGKSAVLNVTLPNLGNNIIAESALFKVNRKDLQGYTDYRGEQVIGIATWIPEFNFSIVVEKDISEVYSRYFELRDLFIIIGAICTLLVVSLSSFMFVISRRANEINNRSKEELEQQVLERTDKLMQAESKNRSVLSSVADGIFGINNHGVCVFFNDSASHLLGYKEDEAIGEKYFQLFHHKLSDGSPLTLNRNPIMRAIKDNKITRISSSTFTHKDGRQVPVEYSVAPITGQQETEDNLAAVVAFQDISERLEERQRLDRILAAAPVAMIVINQNDVIEQANKTTEKMLGWRLPELIGKSIDTIVPEHRKSEHQRFTKEYWHEPVVYRSGNEDVPLDIVTKSGAVIEVESVYTPFSFADENHIIVSLRDVTQENMAKKALLEAKQLSDEASRAKSDFLANMSHEIRTPMNAIIGMSHLALEFNLEKKPRNYIKKVNRAAESLLGIINDILDFSKIEAGKLELENIDFYLEDVMHDVSNIIGLQTHQKGLELLFNIDNQVPVYLRGDPLRLNQILINLANNASKFTEHGQIVISVKLAEQENQRVKVRFAVQDSGIGMSEEQQQHLFHSFSQGDSSTTRKYGGTGLGLTISKNLVALMQGQIWVESEVNKGSCFYFDVWLGLPKGKREKKFTDQQVNLLLDKKVLIVDDNSMALDVLKNIMNSFGCKVTTANNGEQAIDIVKQGKCAFDFALIDWQMPGLDGIATIEKLSELVDEKSKNFVMVTAHGKEQVKQKVEQLNITNINSFLTKPVTASSIFDELMVFLGQSYVASTRQLKHHKIITDTQQVLGGAKVLLVEDNELNQELACELLKKAGVFVDTADNGQQAVEMIEKEQYDGVLMDLQMPIMDGYTATSIIRQKHPQLPIIAMTANAMAGDKEKVIAAGMNDHIAKPIYVKDMFATMSQWIKPSGLDIPTQTSNSVLSQTKESLSQGNNHALTFHGFHYINSQKGLQVCNLDDVLYVKILKKFITNQDRFFSHFNEAFAEHNLDEATRIAHSLKGASANIGAEQLQHSAAVLEKSCTPTMQTEVITNHLMQCNTHLLNVLEELTNFFHQRDIENTQHYSNKTQLSDSHRQNFKIEDFALQFKLLAKMVADFEIDALDTAEEIAQFLKDSEYQLAFDKILTSIESYDFDKSHSLLMVFMQQHNLNSLED